jgi:predicted DCC family thiol-disulfide oxidoreductase YuxK
MLDGIDFSNLQGPPEAYRNQPWYRDAAFGIVQAIPRPSPPGLTGPQLRALKEDGKYAGIYTWLWDTPSWRMDRAVATDQRIRLSTVPDDVQVDMRPWLDLEDNQSAEWQSVSIEQRYANADAALEVLDAWAAAHSLPRAGIYTSRYMIDLLYGGWTRFTTRFAGRKLWLAHYMDSRGLPEPGSLIGGDVVAHQYTSTPIDRNKLLESEIIGQEADVPDPQLQAQLAEAIKERDAVVNSFGWVAGDLLRPVVSQKTSSAALRRLVAGIRSEAEKHNIAHA